MNKSITEKLVDKDIKELESNTEELKALKKRVSTPPQSDWERTFDIEASKLGLDGEQMDGLRQVFRQLLQQAWAEGYEEGTKGLPSKGVEEYEREIRQEILKEAIAYLKKKNPVRVPSSVMVDYTEAITDLENLAKIIKKKL